MRVWLYLTVILRTRVVYELIADEVRSTELAIRHIRRELVSRITVLLYRQLLDHKILVRWHLNS